MKTTTSDFQSRLLFFSRFYEASQFRPARGHSERIQDPGIGVFVLPQRETLKERRGEAREKLDGERARLENFQCSRWTRVEGKGERSKKMVPSLFAVLSLRPSLLSFLPLFSRPLLRRHRKGIVPAERERDRITGSKKEAGRRDESGERIGGRATNGIDPAPAKKKKKKKTHQERSRSSQDRLLARASRLGPRDDAEDRVLHLAHGVGGAPSSARPVAAERRRRRVAAHAARTPEGRAPGSPASCAAWRAVPARASAEARRRRWAPELVHSSRGVGRSEEESGGFFSPLDGRKKERETIEKTRERERGDECEARKKSEERE